MQPRATAGVTAPDATGTRPAAPATGVSPRGPDHLGTLIARAVRRRTDPPAATRAPAGMRGPVIQRVLEPHAGKGPSGQWEGNRGLKYLLRETDDGKFYFKAGTGSTLFTWSLVEVTVSGDRYTYVGTKRDAPAPPPTRRDWQEHTSFNEDGTMMFYNSSDRGRSYPHVTIDVVPAAKELTDVVNFASMHYSRSFDDPYRCGYDRAGGGKWTPDKPNRERDKQKECDDAVDAFFKAVGLPDRVVRATESAAAEAPWRRSETAGVGSSSSSSSGNSWRSGGSGSSGRGTGGSRPWDRY